MRESGGCMRDEREGAWSHLSAWGECAESRGEASSVDNSQFRLNRSRDKLPNEIMPQTLVYIVDYATIILRINNSQP
jgi:hypothetical protein